MQTTQIKITQVYWVLALVLFLLLSALTLVSTSYQWKQLEQQETSNFDHQVNVAIEVITQDLREGQIGNIETLFKQWAKHIPNLLSVSIYIEGDTKIAAFESNQYSDNVVHYSRELPGEKLYKFNAVLDLSELESQHHNYLLLIAIANLTVALLLMYMMWAIMQRYVFVPLKKSEKELIDLANLDSLTHIYNRRHFIETSKIQIERCKRLQQPLCMVMFDLDHFKDINDHYGHAIGDLVLILFSNEVQLQIRNYDILGRIGGEEFAACMPDLPLESADRAIKRIVQLISELPTLEGKKSVPLTVSAGVTELKPDDSFESLLKRADDAMYQAKDAGRNCVKTV
jgi:diguanylate cyclase (GGDEF)-like protein